MDRRELTIEELTGFAKEVFAEGSVSGGIILAHSPGYPTASDVVQPVDDTTKQEQ